MKKESHSKEPLKEIQNLQIKREKAFGNSHSNKKKKADENEGGLNECYEDLQTSKVSIFDLTQQEKNHLQNVPLQIILEIINNL